jgi:hypothetical protein
MKILTRKEFKGMSFSERRDYKKKLKAHKKQVLIDSHKECNIFIWILGLIFSPLVCLIPIVLIAPFLPALAMLALIASVPAVLLHVVQSFKYRFF